MALANPALEAEGAAGQWGGEFKDQSVHPMVKAGVRSESPKSPLPPEEVTVASNAIVPGEAALGKAGARACPLRPLPRSQCREGQDRAHRTLRAVAAAMTAREGASDLVRTVEHPNLS